MGLADELFSHSGKSYSPDRSFGHTLPPLRLIRLVGEEKANRRTDAEIESKPPTRIGANRCIVGPCKGGMRDAFSKMFIIQPALWQAERKPCCERCGNMFRFYSILHHHHFPSQHHTTQSIDRSIVSSAFGVKSDTAPPFPSLTLVGEGSGDFIACNTQPHLSGNRALSLVPRFRMVMRYCDAKTIRRHIIAFNCFRLPDSGIGMLSDVCELPR